MGSVVFSSPSRGGKRPGPTQTLATAPTLPRYKVTKGMICRVLHVSLDHAFITSEFPGRCWDIFKSILLETVDARLHFVSLTGMRFVRTIQSRSTILPHTSRFFVAELQIFLSGLNRVKICRDISLPHTSRFFVATNRV